MGFLCWGLGELGVSFRILGEYDRCFFGWRGQSEDKLYRWG